MLTNNNLGINGIKSLCLALFHLPSLQNLILDSNIHLGTFSSDCTAAMNALAQLVKDNRLPKLEYLSIKGNAQTNNYTKGAISELCDALRSNSSLTKLDISSNRMGDKGFERLAKALGNDGNRSLQIVRCDDNKTSVKAMRALEKHLRNNASICKILPVQDLKKLTESNRSKQTRIELIATIDGIQQLLLINRSRCQFDENGRQPGGSRSEQDPEPSQSYTQSDTKMEPEGMPPIGVAPAGHGMQKRPQIHAEVGIGVGDMAIESPDHAYGMGVGVKKRKKKKKKKTPEY